MAISEPLMSALPVIMTSLFLPALIRLQSPP